jgi:hypothetical protein
MFQARPAIKNAKESLNFYDFQPSQVNRSFLMRTTAFIALLSLFLGSCARIPEPVGYEYSEQPKMQAAYHWDVLASDVANQINNELIINDYLQTPVYVKATCGDENSPCEPNQTSSFNEAFRDLLITELVKFGVPVQQEKIEEAITVHYKVQVIYHKAQRVRTIRPGLMTSIATGIMVFRNVPHEFKTIAAAGMVDFMNTAAVKSSAHEVIITTSMVAKERYLFRTSDIYYINDRDYFQYQDSSSQATELPFVAPDTAIKKNMSPVMPNEPEVNTDSAPEDDSNSSDI